VVLGRAIIKTNEESKGKYWLCCDADWLDRIALPINEPLSIPVGGFKKGTTIELVGKLEDTK
jgi:hypothetical protein